MLENLEKYDVYEAVVIYTTHRGAVVKLLGSGIEAFCFCCAKRDDRVMVSISKLDVETGYVRCRIDSFRYDAA